MRRVNPPDPIVIFFALPDEARPFRKLARGHPHVEIILTGMGPRNAERSTRARLASRPPTLVLTCGFAGGLNPSLAPETLLFSPDAPPAIAARLAASGARPGRIHCAPRVATTAAEKQSLFLATGADAVEMESGVIRNVCQELGLPAVTLRVISDTATENLPLDFNRLTDANQNLDFAKLAWTIATSPAKIPALISLGKRTATAATTLARALDQFLRSPE